jgi:hypothetical protein
MKTERNPRGAGRPKKNNVEFQVRIAPELADYARAQPEGQSVFVEKLIENHAQTNWDKLGSKPGE